MLPQLTIGIPTCGRPQAIRNCLESIQKNVHVDYKTIVVDSLITEESLAVYNSFKHTECLGFSSPIGPSAARQLIAEKADTPFILFLDDDNEVTPNCVELMLTYLTTHPEIQILGGAWREDGSVHNRAVGQQFNLGFQDNQRVIFKSFVTVEQIHQLKLESFRVSGVLATMMVRNAVFDQVNFDPRYDFFYELFDFFLQCHYQNINIYAFPNAVFEHKPLKYTQSTLRENNKGEKEKQKFIEKWQIVPIGSLDLATSRKKQNLVKRILKKIS
jgi:GT2 family glycosyltransferase